MLSSFVTRTILSVCAIAMFSLAAAAPDAFAGPTVKVRVEAEGTTLLSQTTVTLGAPEPVSGCPANSVAAAINLAVGGNWDHGEAGGSGGDFTETILGRTQSFEPESSTWAEWVDYKWGGGICTDLLSEGDEVLMIADREPPPYAPTVLPLIIAEAPSSVVAGEGFAVKVDAVRTPAGTFAEPGDGTPEPVAGVTVSGSGTSAVTGSDGVAHLSVPSAGTAVLDASGAGFAASAPVSVCVRASASAACGAASGAGGVAGFTAEAAPYKGPFALVAAVTSLLNGRTYAHGHAPRLISGRISAHSSVTSVSLALRRSFHGRCFAYDGARGRFTRARCGTTSAFAVSKTASFSYLLPATLAPGRYVLDVQAHDTAGNSLTPARGSSRLVFHVR